MRYVHLPEGGDMHSGHGMSAQWSERTISHKGRDVLYLLTDAVVDTVCCGDRVFHYATVLGYVEDWKKERNEAGLPVSIVNAVVEESAREEIERLLQDKEPDVQVSFRSDQPG
ncbi:MAG: hypothetical protein ACOC9B_03655 [Chloroflexota bacterium]